MIGHLYAYTGASLLTLKEGIVKDLLLDRILQYYTDYTIIVSYSEEEIEHNLFIIQIMSIKGTANYFFSTETDTYALWEKLKKYGVL